MGDRLDTLPAETLDAQTRRLARLARGLLYQQHDAEDAVQEAWLTVLRPEGVGPRSLRDWLTGTVRRLARTTRRADARRQRRERSAARAEPVPSAAHTAGRIEVLRLLLEAVEGLEEPYRRTIVLRFFDDLAPREIARREGVPVNTVRSRVGRGLERLRERLDAGREGRRGEFLAALVPLAGQPPWVAAPVASAASSLVRMGGVHVMRQQVTLAALVLGLVLMAGAGWMVLSGGTAQVEHSLAPPTLHEGALAVATPLEEEEAKEAMRTAARPGLVGERDWFVRGQVTLDNREALPDAPLVARLHAGPSTAGELLIEERLHADETGRFEWGLPRPDRLTTIALSIDLADHQGSSKDTSVPEGDEPPQDLLVRVRPWDVHAVGRVLDPEGGPVAGARVHGTLTETRTDAEGRYRLRGTTYRDEVRGTVVAAGYRPARIVAVPDGPGEVQVEDIVLAAGRTLRGRVTDEAGAPVVGAEISAWTTEVRTISDDSGRFVLTSLDPELEEQWLYATGTGLCDQGRLVTAEELAAGEVEWVLERGAVVRGHVFEEDGTPVSGAHIWLALVPNSRPGFECWSNAEGAFEFPGVPEGEKTLWSLRDGLKSARQPVVVPPSGEVLDGLDVRMVAGHWLAGRVVDGVNRPVPWVWVYFNDPMRAHHVDAVHTDTEGRFRIAGLPTGRVTLGFLRDGYPRHVEPFRELDRGDLIVRLRSSGALAGRVVDGRTGEPVPAFRIRFVAPWTEEGDERVLGYGGDWAADGPGMPFTGSDGYWAAAGSVDLVPGTVTGIRVDAAGYAPSIHDRAVVTADPDPDALVIALYPASARVQGRVIAAEDGVPLSGATVRTFRTRPREDEAQAHSTLTDELGDFALEGVPVGRTSLVIDHPDRVRATDGPFEVPPTGSVQRLIELGRGSTLDGRLLDPAGNPLAGEVVDVHAHQVDDPGRNKWESMTDHDGRFRVEGLKQGTYQLVWKRALGRDQIAYYLYENVVVDGVGAATVELQLEGEATIRGRLGFDGGTPEFVRVHLRPWPPSSEPGADLSRTHNTVAMDGEFEFDHITPGTYRVLVSERGASGSVEVEVPERGEVEVWIDVRAPDR